MSAVTRALPARLRRQGRPEQDLDVVFYVPAVTPLLGGRATAFAGGAETQVLLVTRELARRGIRVGLIGYGREGELADEVDGVRVLVRCPPQGDRRLVGFLLEVLVTLRAVLAVDAQVYVQRAAGYPTGLVGLAAKLKRGRFVYSSALAFDFDVANMQMSTRDRLLYRWGLTMADELVAQTEEQVELCRARLRRRAVLIPSVAEPGASRRREPRAFLWVGRAEQRKRPLEFVTLARAVPEARFQMVLVRPGTQWAQTAAEVERRAREVPNLEILGPLPRAELGELMEEAVAIVSTSDVEGMANVLLEGWARGIPALVLHHDPDGVVERHRLGAFAHGSPQALAAEARAFWRERENRDEIDRRCRSYIAVHHSASDVGEQWLRLLERLVTQPVRHEEVQT